MYRPTPTTEDQQRTEAELREHVTKRFGNQSRRVVRETEEATQDVARPPLATSAEGNDSEEEFEDLDQAMPQMRFYREKHMAYLLDSLHPIHERQGSSFHCLRPWVVYWTLHAGDILGELSQVYASRPPKLIAGALLRCLSREPDPENGVDRMGFGGGPGQQPHLASSYAAVAALCILEDTDALLALPRASIRRWLLALRQPNGGFRMHIGGEVDTRASYCAAVLVQLLHLDDGQAGHEPVLNDATRRYVTGCQTYEGGFACNATSSEAHGGYTYCALAALLLMHAPPSPASLAAVRRWLVHRQFSFEGGFNGRTNKLVDACYSHWIGSCFPLLRLAEAYHTQHPPPPLAAPLLTRNAAVLHVASMQDMRSATVAAKDLPAWQAAETLQTSQKADTVAFLSLRRCLRDTPGSAFQSTSAFAPESQHWLEAPEVFQFYEEDESDDQCCHLRRLQNYLLYFSQNEEDGGMADKPSVPVDRYHTCYALTGMSSAQNLWYQTLLHQYDQYKMRFERNKEPGIAVPGQPEANMETNCPDGIPYVAYARQQGFFPVKHAGNLNGCVGPYLKRLAARQRTGRKSREKGVSVPWSTAPAAGVSRKPVTEVTDALPTQDIGVVYGLYVPTVHNHGQKLLAQSLLRPVNPLFVIHPDHVWHALKVFGQRSHW